MFTCYLSNYTGFSGTCQLRQPFTSTEPSANIINCYFFVKCKDFFSIYEDSKSDYARLYCDMLISHFELELDCEYSTLDEEKQDSIHNSVVADMMYEYSLDIDGYTFLNSSSGEEITTYDLEGKPEITNEVIVFSKSFDRGAD
jgi:hypothetical protein